MRIIFMGTPDFAVPTLDALVAAGPSNTNKKERSQGRSKYGVKRKKG